ncbi:hypothetical protein B0J17DRAFT_681543 [Rhizoctonia solani]|nr:hypothetical protein B0J17DRAFT_681543 [Rhizoctonia solani]
MGLSPTPDNRAIDSRTASGKSSSPPGSTTGSRPLSRNAQAQARLRARRRAYVESLEAEIKRLQNIVDATALRPSRRTHTSPGNSNPLRAHSSSVQSFSPNSEPSRSFASLDTVQQLHLDNDRLRRERDAFRVQAEALMSFVSRGCALPPSFSHPNPSSTRVMSPDHEHPSLVSCDNEEGHFSTPGSETDPGDRQSQDPFSHSPLIQPDAYMKDETNHLFSLYGSNLAFLRHLDPHTQGPTLYSVGDKPIQLPTLPGSSPFGAM